MSTRDTAPEPRHDTTDTTTDRPGRFDRVTSAVAWYTPELTGAAASAGAAATVWAPLGAIGVALAAWIATDQVKLARERRRHHRQTIAARGERAQLDTTESTDDETSGAEPASDGQAERPGWEVSA